MILLGPDEGGGERFVGNLRSLSLRGDDGGVGLGERSGLWTRLSSSIMIRSTSAQVIGVYVFVLIDFFYELCRVLRGPEELFVGGWREERRLSRLSRRF